MISRRYFFLCSNFFIDFEFFVDNAITIDDYKMYKNVKLFLKHVKKEVELNFIVINNEYVQKFLRKSIKS